MGERAVNGGDGSEPCILITGAANETAFGFARALRARWGDGIFLVGTDREPAHLVAAEQFLDVYEPIAVPGGAERTEALLDLVDRYEVELVVPLEDADLAPLAELEDLHGAETAIDDIAIARQAVDRLAMADLIDATARSRDDLTSPRTTVLERTPWSRHGLAIKPRFHRGLTSVRVLTELDAYEATMASYTRWPGPVPLVAQTLCTPPEFTIDVFRSKDGAEFRAVCRERLATLGGQCTQARVIDHPELAELTERLITGLRVTGLATVQVMDGPVGEWLVTDLTLRPSSGTALTITAGVDLYSRFVADRLDLPFEADWTAPITEDRYVVRSFTEWLSPGPS